MDAQVQGHVRRVGEGSSPDASGKDFAPLNLNNFGELLVAQGASPYEEITRLGEAYEVNTGNTTALDLAGVIAFPTTAVMLAIYNNEPDGGKSLIIDRCWATNTTAPASLGHFHLIGLLGTVREAVPTDATPTGAFRALNGMGAKKSNARVVVNTTVPAGTGIAANWFALTPSVGTGVTSLIGMAAVADVNGRIIVPPGRYFGVHCFASAVGFEFNAGIQWHERQLTLG